MKKIIIIFWCLIFFVSFSLLNKIQFNNENWLSQSNIIEQNKNYVDKNFTHNSEIVFIFKLKENYFKNEIIKKILNLSDDLKNKPYIYQIENPLYSTYIEKDEFGINILKFKDFVNKNKIEEYKQKFEKSPYHGHFLSKDNLNVATVLKIKKSYEDISIKKYQEILIDIKNTIAKYEISHEKLYFSGDYYINKKLNIKNKDSLILILPIVIFSILIILHFFYKNPYKISLIILSAVLTSSISINLFYLFDFPFTIISIILPILLFIISISDTIHILAYGEKIKKNNIHNKQFIIELLKRSWKPCIITSLTTAFGFGSFYFSELIPFKQFSLVSFIAILLSYVLIILINLSFIYVFENKIFKNKNEKNHQKFHDFVYYLTTISNKHHKKILFLTFSLFFITFFGFFKINTNGNLINNFLFKQDKIYKDFVYPDQVLKGSGNINIVIKKNNDDEFKKIEILEKIKLITKLIKNINGINDVKTYLDPIEMLHEKLAINNNKYPQSNTELSQEILFLEFSRSDSEPSILEPYLNFNYNSSLIKIYTDNINTKKTDIIIKKINKILKQYFNEQEYHYSGQNVYNSYISNYVINSQIQSIIITIITIFTIFSIFLNVKLGAIAFGINLIILSIVYGLISLLNIPYDFGTLLMFSISFGINVDNCIHVLSDYNRNKKINKTHTIINSIQNVGVPLLHITILFILIFAVLLLTKLFLITKFSILSTIVIIMSFLFICLLLPVILKSKNNPHNNC